VPLIPRARLAWVLGQPGATVDGLHLSAAGHAALAKVIWGSIGDMGALR